MKTILETSSPISNTLKDVEEMEQARAPGFVLSPSIK